MIQPNPVISPDELPRYSEAPLQPVESSYKSVLLIEWSIAYTCMLAGIISLILLVDDVQKWQVILPVTIVFVTAVALTYASIIIGFKNRSWALRDKDIIFKTGWLFQSTHIIPFVKVQHAIVRSGPIGRRYGLASIRLMTAASHGGDISIKGLKQETADQLKGWIMEKIATHASPGV